MLTVEGGSSYLLQAIRLPVIVGGGLTALALFGVFTLLRLPIGFIYGAVGGLGMSGWPHTTILMFTGALFGRYHFEKKYGRETWRNMVPVLAAGYMCGFGIIGMLAASVSLISKSVIQLPY
jgi:hypothetical protein